jgi:hypothetical protein
MTVSNSQRVGILSLPLLAGLAVIFGLLGIAGSLVFRSVLLEVVLNLFLILPVSLIVARISAKSFLLTGSVNILLLGTAVLVFGVMAVLGGFVSSIGVEEGIAVYTLGAFAAASLHATSASLTYRGSPRRETRLKLRVLTSYIGATIFALLISSLAVVSEVLDKFGITGTLEQRVLILGTTLLFFVSAAFFSRVYLRSHSPVIFWYSLALATTTVAFMAFSATRINGDMATWTGIGGLSIASVYFLRSVVAAPSASSSAKSSIV